MLSIKCALQKDIEDIMEIEKASFIKPVQEDRQVFLERIKRCPKTFLLFTENNKTAGYMSAEYLTKLPQSAKDLALNHLPEKDITTHIIYLSSFALLPEYRGKGNGRLAFNIALEYFKNLLKKGTVVLLVNKEWQGALKIYSQSGFKPCFEIKDFFPSEKTASSDGIVMSLEV